MFSSLLWIDICLGDIILKPLFLDSASYLAAYQRNIFCLMDDNVYEKKTKGTIPVLRTFCECDTHHHHLFTPTCDGRSLPKSFTLLGSDSMNCICTITVGFKDGSMHSQTNKNAFHKYTHI